MRRPRSSFPPALVAHGASNKQTKPGAPRWPTGYSLVLSLLCPRFGPRQRLPQALWYGQETNKTSKDKTGAGLERVIYSTLRIAFEYVFK